MSGKRKQVTPTAPFESAPIIADGALKKHAWERAISLAPAAFACSIHRYGLTAANCSCHEAGRHQVQYKTQMASSARVLGTSWRNRRCTRASSSNAENSKQQEDQKQTTSRYPAGAGCASCGKTESINPDQHWASPTHTLSTQTTNNKRTRKTWLNNDFPLSTANLIKLNQSTGMIENARRSGTLEALFRQNDFPNDQRTEQPYLTDDQLNRLGLFSPRHCWTSNNELASLASLQEQDKIDKWKRKAKTTVGAKLGRDC
ncbi:hypothetical protein T07_15266 [Trichinella nelsoni]|uniref:Uncharacterized protein n=1 Tax=Trichinella nelsoni TaxID=6336 RepID=A0A0V0RKW1_9BILA|nr:hypothetical protein T07_15266 [Trichinella nelsoni]